MKKEKRNISPFTGKEMIVNKESRKLKFRNEEFEIISHTLKCMDTGEQFEDEVFAQLNYDQLLNQYKAKYPDSSPDWEDGSS